MTDCTERTVTYQSKNADFGQEWIAQFFYRKTRLHMLFFGATEVEAVAKVNDFWELNRAEREARWAAKAERKAASK